jgi:small subunit ribosomal protein S16
MAVKIRLQRKGKKKQPFYHIVIADSRSPRDGRFIEKIGTYNPLTIPATIDLDREKAYNWLKNGAQPTETVKAILRFKGVMFKKHLERGVKMGLFSEEVAETKYKEWVDAKEAKIEKRRQKALADKAAAHAKMAGVDEKSAAPAKVVPKVEAAAPLVEAPVAEAAAQEEE